MSELKSKNKTINQQMQELSQLVEWFDSSDFEIEAGIAKYKQAEVLADAIEGQLSELKNDINVLKQKFDQ